MILCDTGPLVALCDAADPYHETCVEAAEALLPMLTTHPCLTEAMHLLRRTGGWRSQALLWDYVCVACFGYTCRERRNLSACSR